MPKLYRQSGQRKLAVFLFLTFYIPLLSLSPVVIAEWLVTANTQSFNYSGPVTIGDNFKDWEGATLTEGNTIYTKSVAELGVGKTWRWGTSRFGYTGQYHYYLDFSDDTARYHHHDKNFPDVPLKETFDVYLSANHFRGNGLYLRHDYAVGYGIIVGGKLSYLQTRNLMLGQAYGTYDPSPDLFLDNETQITIDYAYTEERILDRPVEPPEGKGWLLELQAEWQYQKHHAFIVVDNIWTKIEWPNAPGSLITGDLVDLTNSRAPAVQFKEFYASLTQALPQHITAQYTYQVASPKYPINVGLEYEQLDTLKWLKLLVGLQLSDDSRLVFNHTPEVGAWGIEFKNRFFIASLEADKLDAFEANIFNFGLGFNIPL